MNSVQLTSNFIGRGSYTYYYSQPSGFIGRVDEFLIYEKALLPSDVSSLYKGLNPLQGSKISFEVFYFDILFTHG
jgi:hypothetical protein